MWGCEEYRVLSVLLVADRLYPIRRFAVELFLNGDVRHRGRRCGAVPMLFTGRERDHVAGPNLLDRASPALREPRARRHDQRLAQWMGVPRGPGAGLERDKVLPDLLQVEPRQESGCVIWRMSCSRYVAEARQIRLSSDSLEEHERSVHVGPRHFVSSHGISESHER